MHFACNAVMFHEDVSRFLGLWFETGHAVAYLVEAPCYKPEGRDEVDFFN
jgi:hypothetical protein